MLLHVRLAEADEAVRKRRLELGDFSKLRDGHIELLLFVRRDSSLHVLRGLRRESSATQTIRVIGRESRFLRLTDFQELIGVNIIQSLMNSGRPRDFHFSLFRGSESEMKALVA